MGRVPTIIIPAVVGAVFAYPFVYRGLVFLDSVFRNPFFDFRAELKYCKEWQALLVVLFLNALVLSMRYWDWERKELWDEREKNGLRHGFEHGMSILFALMMIELVYLLYWSLFKSPPALFFLVPKFLLTLIFFIPLFFVAGILSVWLMCRLRRRSERNNSQ